jgi:5,10-methylenetetrahydromethanopterin reductase|tara:strand:- start:5533 stop:6591 length:1059 start_codon:yes stop_codon:yes gene_type:complete
MEFSVAVASQIDSWKVVKRAEELGFTSSWFYDTQLLNPDVFICMALAAANTNTIRLGTGVLIPSNRIEPVTANAFATLNKIAPGRIDFGVGTGFTGRRTMGLSAIHLEEMKTYIQRVQGLLLGETISWDFEDKERKIRFLNPDFGLINIEDPVPLHVSAMGPRARELTAELEAGWLNFSGDNEAALRDLDHMQSTWAGAAHNPDDLKSTLFFLGAVLSGDAEADASKLMVQAAPSTAVIFHNMLDSIQPMPLALPQGMADVLEAYRAIHAEYSPADARYLDNHRGHLMFLKEEEKALLTPEMVKATTMSGTRDELLDRLGELGEAGYTQFAVQVVSGAEDALEDWSEIFARL